MACHERGRGHGFSLDAVVVGGLRRAERYRTFRQAVTGTVRMSARRRVRASPQLTGLCVTISLGATRVDSSRPCPKHSVAANGMLAGLTELRK